MIFLGFKKYSTIVALLAISLLFVANCKPKDEPFDEGKGSPVFLISGSVDGRPTQYIAGVDSYYMYSQYRYDVKDSVYWMEAELKKTNCTTCPNSILISIADAEVSSGTGSVNISKVVQPDTFVYLLDSGGSTSSNTYKFDFIGEDTGYKNPIYEWDFGGAGKSSLKNPSFTFTDTQTRNVCLTVTDLTSSCKNTACNTIKPQVAGNDTCSPRFSYVVLGDTSIQFVNQSQGGNYLWDFGDGLSSTQTSPIKIYSRKDTYKVCLTVSSATCTQTLCKSVVLADTNFTCGVNFYVGSTKLNTFVTKISKTSTVVVRYIDENGVLYQSNLQNQPIGSNFTKVSTRNYDPNEKGEKTQLLNITFKCRVFNSIGGFKDIVVTNGVVAIAYP